MLNIAIQGGRASFHDITARKFFSQDITTINYPDFHALCRAVAEDHVDYGVIAIENSIAAGILSNYTLIEQYDLKIIGEVSLHIELHLMALPGQTIEDIKLVKSHYMALNQCREFLNEHGAGEKFHVEEAEDTAESARLIAEEKRMGEAAIAGFSAAQLYGLTIINEGVHTIKKNYTRFFILQSKNNHRATDHSDNSKSTIHFETSHKVGSLARVLNIFVEHGINLSMIQSVPILGRPDQYSFYVDCEWSDYNEYLKGLEEMKKDISAIKILGEYKKGEKIYDRSDS